jgi:sugar phosphate isomerase/epimerase
MEQQSRRDWLLGMAALGTSSLGFAQTKSGQAGAVRFGVRTPFAPELSLRERALLLKRIGFDGIELGNEWTEQPLEAIQEQLARTGIAVSAVVGSIQLLNLDPAKRAQGVETDRKQLEKARQLGAVGVIEVPVFGENKFPDISPLMTAKEVEEKLLVLGLKQLIPDVQRTGVAILLEPCNRKETHFLNTQDYGAHLIKQVDAPGFKLLSDFYHMQIEEKDIGDTLSRVGNLTGYVHLADGAKRTEPGSLPFDYRPGFHALKKWGYGGWLTVECKASDNPEASITRALGYLKQQWADA